MAYKVDEILNQCTGERKKVLIYGFGGLSKMISNLIVTKGGCVDSYVVDEVYYDDARVSNNEIKFVPLNQVKNFKEDYILIIGFEGDYKEKISEAGIPEEKVAAADFLGHMATIGEDGTFEEYYQKNSDMFDKSKDLLADEESKIAFDLFVNQKMTGEYEKEYDNKPQYFDEQIIGTNLMNEECFVDCGAFQGETAIAFIDFLKDHNIEKYKKVIEIEPDEKNVFVMKANLADVERIDIVKAGVYDKTGRLFFSSGNGSSSKIEEDGDSSIDVISLDDYFEKMEAKVTFIKMDIEGSEMRALQGAEKVIKRDHPKLAICVYHKYDDLISIPQYLKSLGSEYTFYLRNYSRSGVEAVLYAI